MSNNTGKNKKGMSPFDIADNEGGGVGKNNKKNQYDKEPLLTQKRNSIY